MERAMSVEDKIRRAEEIYYRRKEQENPKQENVRIPARNEKKDVKLFKKMLIQIIICLSIYSIFHLVVNSNYIFSEDFTNKAKEILSQDINFKEIYVFLSTKMNEILNSLTHKDQNQESMQDNQTEQKQEENVEAIQNNTENIQNNEENIGGAEEVLTEQAENVENSATNTDTTEPLAEEEPQLTQMEQDANYIKSTISFIKPVTGTISSAYGWRNPTTATVPKNHKGTDIAAVTGTKIVSATDGTVILASAEGDYGNHLKIQINDVIIVYAHCNKLYVKEGDTIKQGQEIAEVGSTGNTTGPHLHFEVRYQNRYVDPQMILEL